MKKCIECNISKGIAEFYKHPAMSDGHFNKCKTCCKEAAIKNRKSRLEYYREYDRSRGCRQTNEQQRERRKRNPKKYKAQSMINYAIKSGRLFKEPCEICGSTKRVHAHHDDYNKPLNIRWLCPEHHKQWHVENGEGKH